MAGDGDRPLVGLGDVALLATRALPAWRARTTPPPATAEPPLEIHVASEQFAWQIHYPGPDGEFGRTDAALITPANPAGVDRASPHAADDIGLTNVLVLPINRTIVVQLTSRDVIHTFTLPQMRVKQDATPGFVARTWFTPIRKARGRSSAHSYAGWGTIGCEGNTASCRGPPGRTGSPKRQRGSRRDSSTPAESRYRRLVPRLVQLDLAIPRQVHHHADTPSMILRLAVDPTPRARRSATVARMSSHMNDTWWAA